jgi:hypothetical protein
MPVEQFDFLITLGNSSFTDVSLATLGLRLDDPMLGRPSVALLRRLQQW